VPSTILKDAESQFANTIVAALGRLSADKTPPHPAYHFTDEAGLRGILGTRSLWASLATALEDTSEIEYALSRAGRILQDYDVSDNSSFLAEIAPFLDPRKSQTVSTLGLKIYVVSFRTNVDESAHWETYGRAGTGCSLAFGLKPLLISGILCLPVIYDAPTQDKILREFLESNVKVFKKLSLECLPEDSWRLRQRAIQWTALGLWTLAPFLKALCFEHEREWRLTVFDLENVPVKYGKGLSKEVLVRTINNRELPYKILQYDTLPIVGLELGAHAPIQKDDLQLLELLCRATPGFDGQITRSSISFLKR
jgi:hypothetical protein